MWNKIIPAALAALVATSASAFAQHSEAVAAAERLLGSDDEAARLQALLPFTRQRSASGSVTAALAYATAAAGVPATAMVEALRGFATSLDVENDLRTDDRFHVLWEETFTAEGRPIGVARIVWAELQTVAKGTISIHRFRRGDGVEQLWRASGRAATTSELALPLETVTVSSDFGLRPDPMTRPRRAGIGGPLPSALAPIWAGAKYRDEAIRATWRVQPALRLYMHDGVDMAAVSGTPIYAAGDGLVSGARRNGGYGNWIRIEHSERLATAYGHLSRFAPGLKAGMSVARGELIGFVGNTGRSTGPHLHFEVLCDGKTVDPLAHPTTQGPRLTGIDLERFTRMVEAERGERDREAAAALSQ